MSKPEISNKVLITTATLIGYVVLVTLSRRWFIRWGATEDEIQQPLPGDEFMDYASANHAITIHTSVNEVWPWLKQIGQDKAGFYSY